jgi:hypothetical protein
MNSRFTPVVLLADGTLNRSQPRTDGRTGTAMYGSLPLNVAALAPLFAAAIAKGESEIILDLAVYERTRKDGSGTFFGIQSRRIYDPNAPKEAQSEAAAG